MRQPPGDQSCFLCATAPDLVYASTESAFALCGLGPLVPGYTLVATKEHTASAADAIAHTPEFLDFTEQIRAFLSSQYGSCLISEHGRVPACIDPSGTSDPHCYHAHFLLFPGGPNVVGEARSYFAHVQETTTLGRALELATEAKDYFLISPTATEAHLMTRPGRIIRQFARVLVADAIGESRRANWRNFPERELCVQTSQDLRNRFAERSAA